MTTANKLNNVRRYLLEMSDADWASISLISSLIWQADQDRRNNNAYMRAARKFSQEAIEYVTGFWNLPGAGPDGMDDVYAGRAARKSAQNVFAAYPELRDQAMEAQS